MKKLRFDPENLDLWFCPSGTPPVLLNAGHVFDRNKKISKKIDRYRIEVSLACDLRCQYCVVHMNKVSQKGKLMPLGVAKGIIKKFNSEVGSNGSLVLIGGEPLLNWETVKYMISECSGSSIVFTNALKLDAEKIHFFKRNKVLILTSLDGYTLKHNRSRFYPRVKENFATVCANIDKAIRSGCRVGIGCVVHPGNVADVVKIADFFAKKLGSHSLSFAYPHFTTEPTETNRFAMEKYTRGICKLFEYSKRNGIYVDQVGKLLRSILRKEKITSACKAGLAQRTFYPDGRETVCTKLDTIKGYNINSFFRQLPFKNSKCSGCVARNLCGGGCPWDASVFPNEVGVDKRICRHNRKIVEYIIRDMGQELKGARTEKEAAGMIKKKYYPMMLPVWKGK